MIRLLPRCFAVTLVILGGVFTTRLSAKFADWHDTAGNTFRLEPVEALGPVALFRTEKRGSRLIPFQLLSREECVRFYQETKDNPARAADWKNSKSELGRDTFAHTREVQSARLIRTDRSGHIEPEFYIVLYASANDSRSLDMFDAVLPLYNKIRAEFPNQVEALFFGVGHTQSAHDDLATSRNMPWLITDLNEEPSMRALWPLASRENLGVVVFTREGVPLFISNVRDMPKITQPVLELAGLLDSMRDENPKSWKARAHYLSSIQPVVFANGRSEPVLIGNPLRADGLRERKIHLVRAQLTVSPEGKVSHVDLAADEANLPAPMMQPIAQALERSAMFVPAVDHGRFVEAVYPYVLEVPPTGR